MNDTALVSSPAPLRADGTSLHRQIFMVLRDQIARGARAPGSMLPKEETLCEQFGVSRVTVRRALADLEAAGLVQRRHGRGTFVREDVPAPRPAMHPTVMEELEQQGRETQVRVLGVGPEVPPAQVANFLGTAPGEPALHALRLRSNGTVPLMLTDAWVPMALGSRITEAALKRKPLYKLLVDQGVTFGHVIQEISAEVADPYRASLLQTAVSAPLIRLTRLLYDPDDRPLQHLTIHLSPERSRIVMDIASEQIDTLSAGHIAHDLHASPAADGRGRSEASVRARVAR